MEIRGRNRKRHTYVQRLIAPPDEIFPLLCPVRETEWCKAWDPDWIITDSGLVEEDCLFQMPGPEGKTLWIVTRHEPERHFVEMLKITPDHSVCRLEIRLEPDGEGGTKAHVAYAYTAMSPAGDRFLETFTEAWYDGFMREWEDELNGFLARHRDET